MPVAPRPMSVELVVAADRTGGAYSLLEVEAHQALRLRPHVVTLEDLHLLVLEGAAWVALTATEQELAPGDQVMLPRQAPRTIALAADTRLLCLTIPATAPHVLALADGDIVDDDIAALLAAAGVRLLPRSVRLP